MNTLALGTEDVVALAHLPADVRAEVRLWMQQLETVTPPVTAALKRIAERLGVSFPTARRRYYAVQQDGWRGLVNRSKAREGVVGLPDEVVQYWQQLCVENQRKCKPAYQKLRREFFSGATIPGVPSGTPRNVLPRGWSYENLMRFKPTEWQLKAIRIGKGAASDLGPMVYTTRADLWVGSHYLFDDIVHDHFVNVLDTRKPGRPVEFHGLDLHSGCKIGWGIAARTENDLTGRMESLREEHMRFLLASILSSSGYSPRGTVMVVEHGTAAIRSDLEQILSDSTRGTIRVARSGIQGDQALIGQYAGRSKGNFRFKGALESLGNLIHNEMADTLLLPGQTGRNTDERPEELHGLLRANDALLNAMVALQQDRPEIVQWLRFPVVSLAQFRAIAETIYARINARTDHRLEGWDLQTVPADGGMTVRRMSPAEVWQSGRRELTPLAAETVSQMLYRDSAQEVRVTERHEIEVMDKQISADALRFRAEALTPDEKYQAVLNPFAADHLYLYDARGRYVGRIPRIARPSRGDIDAVRREMGRVNADLAERLATLAPLGKRITEQRVADARANADALSALDTDDRLARRAAAAGKRMLGSEIPTPAEAAPEPVEFFAAPKPTDTGEEPVDEVEIFD